MLGVRAEVAGTVLLDRVHLVHLVFAETVSRKGGHSESEREDRGNREHDQVRLRQGQRARVHVVPRRGVRRTVEGGPHVADANGKSRASGDGGTVQTETL